jgi:hypothetical protein
MKKANSYALLPQDDQSSTPEQVIRVSRQETLYQRLQVGDLETTKTSGLANDHQYPGQSRTRNILAWQVNSKKTLLGTLPGLQRCLKPPPMQSRMLVEVDRLRTRSHRHCPARWDHHWEIANDGCAMKLDLVEVGRPIRRNFPICLVELRNTPLQREELLLYLSCIFHCVDSSSVSAVFHNLHLRCTFTLFSIQDVQLEVSGNRKLHTTRDRAATCTAVYSLLPSKHFPFYAKTNTTTEILGCMQ